MKEKHPERSPRDYTRFEFTPPSTAFTAFTRREVNISIKKTKSGLGSDGTGLLFDHLKCFARNSTEGSADSCQKLSKFATIIAKGELCPEIAEWFASAPLVPFRKEDDGVRPIAVGETLRRLVSRLLMYRAKEAAVSLLFPLQLGIGVSSPAKGVGQALQILLAAKGDANHLALLKVDLANAFN